MASVLPNYLYQFCCILLLVQFAKLETSDNYAAMQSCGKLFQASNFQGEYIPIYAGDNFPVDQHSLTETGSITVEQACHIRICDEKHFERCTILDSGSHTVNGSIASISCDCSQQCHCSSVYIRKLSCGRAYLEGGCTTCQALYTNLEPGRLAVFPEQYSESVTAFRLRKGCALSIYSQSNFQGNETVFGQETVEDFQGSVGSYQCVCNDSLYLPLSRPKRPEFYPTLLDVPIDSRKLMQMLSEKGGWDQHPGLLAATKSSQNGRSPKNAYILVLGSTGAGKSSAINLLFDNPSLTRVGSRVSTTDSIHEFRIPVPIDELGISNSELRVIDTPGLGDTRGLAHDAKFLATLDNYLSTHEELKERIPNVVLIFHKFTDNRYNGENANFVKMLRGFDTLRERITDKHYSNIVFVFSHYMSTTRKERRRPTDKINNFKKVIHDYTLFPRPTHITLAENKAKEEQLPMVNGYYKLPNGDFYPKNLFDKMDLITEKCGDPIGQGVFRTAFRNSEDFNISHYEYELLTSNSSEVQQHVDLLTNTHLKVESTEVSRHLQNVWKAQVDPDLKARYPYSLAYLQKALTLRGIRNLDQVPETTSQILELIAAVQQDPATRALLIQGLNIQAPIFSQTTITGYGYHVFQDEPLATSPFQMDIFQDSDIGFRLPSSLSVNIDTGTKEQFAVFEDKAAYVTHRLQSLGMEGSIPASRFTNAVKPGCNIQALSFRQNGCTIGAVMEFRQFQLVLNDNVDLSPVFENAVRALTPFNASDHKSVVSWMEFFNKYGTHVVTSAYGGGSIHVQLESDKPYDPEIPESVFSLLRFAEGMEYAANEARNMINLPRSTNLTGGDPSILKSADFSKVSSEKLRSLLVNWKQSLKYNPAMLTTDLRLMSISQVVRQLGENYSEEIEKTMRLWFQSELTYKPPPSKDNDQSPGYSRDDTPIVQEVVQLVQQQMASIEQLKLAQMKMKQENEEVRLALETQQLETAKQRSAHVGRLREQHQESQKELEQNRREAEMDLETERQRHEEYMSLLRDQHKKALEQLTTHHDWLMNNLAEGFRKREQIYEEELKKCSKKSGGCLKANTAILMADGREKNVEHLKVGDLVMDMQMRPCKVLGVAKEFLLKQRFYGFEKTGPFFFTSNHLFVGGSRSNKDLQLYAASPLDLLRDNPLMAYENVQDMRQNANIFQLEKFDNMTSSSVKLSGKIEIFQESQDLSEDTVMYDILVDSPTGSYIANGFVCKHEIPPLHKWPNTMSILLRLLETPVFRELLPELPYTVKHVYKVHEMVDKVQELVTEYFKTKEFSKAISVQQAIQKLTLKDLNLEQIIAKLFNSSCASSAALRVYSRIGPVIAANLDMEGREKHISESGYTATLQRELYQLISNELEKRLI